MYKADNKSAAKITMMAMTTRSSIRVNAPLRQRISERASARPLASILFMVYQGTLNLLGRFVDGDRSLILSWGREWGRSRIFAQSQL
jgi:hypothetical protein